MSNDESGLFSTLRHSRAENSGLLAALAVGVFTILSLLESANIMSLAWLVLSVTYGVAVIAGVLTFRNWAAAIILTDYLLRHSNQGYCYEENNR